ncbi:MAG: DUF2851 family protein [Muribaculaceae bacterium]|nr:DUF2851 family protein [Muribaculaceae bacterium]
MEQLMQYVWQYRLWPELVMTASDGRRVDIVDAGTINRGSGPDFFNAKVRVDGQMWAGNIEIHVRASDWHRHHHDDDPAYDNVILHVVRYDDEQILRRTDHRPLPQVTMRCADDFRAQYDALVNQPALELPCAAHLGDFPRLFLTEWVAALAFERLQRKADDILATLATTRGDWNTTAYITLARGLGFGANADPMERLARSVPLHRLIQHSDDHTAVEAMLFSRSGLLSATPRDHYEEQLQAEARFYATKFSLPEPAPLNWQMRQRPQNQPHRRIAFLAAFVFDGFPIASSILNLANPADAAALFDVATSAYWGDHSNFGRPCPPHRPQLGAESVNRLCINVVAPLLYAYGQHIGDSRRQDMAVDLLQALKPERNSVTAIFTGAGLEARDAFTTQAYIQLRREYCQTRKCLYCRLGHRILASKVPARH